MTQYATEINGYAIADGLPANWTAQSGGDCHEVKVEADATTPYSDRVLTTGEISGSKVISWNTPGSLTNTEVLTLVKFSGNPTDGSSYSTCLIRTDSEEGGEAGYKVRFYYHATNGCKVRLVLTQAFWGSTTLAEAAFAWVADSWYWVRLRANGSTITAKVWAVGGAEPGGWTLSHSDGTFGHGNVAVVFTSNALKAHYALFSAASAGDVAPGFGMIIQALAALRPAANVAAWIKQNWYTNPASLEPAARLYARTTWRWDASAALVPSTDLSGGLFAALFKWQTWTSLRPNLTLTADAHVAHKHIYEYPGDRFQRRYADDYAEAFSDLLPTGLAWPRESTSVLQRAVTGLTGIWGNKVEDSAAVLLTKEADPRSTVMLLDAWEQAWGLPDRCLAEPLTVHDRQLALVDKITLLGAQDRAFFIERAARIGYKISITEFAPFMAGVSECGDTSNLDDTGNYRWEIGMPEMRFAWVVKVESTRYTWFRAGSGQAGVDHHLELAYATDLECMLRRWKPAQTYLIFDYTPVSAIDLSQMYNTNRLMVFSMM